MYRRLCAVALLALTSVSGPSLSASAAPALHCGDVVSTNVVLTEDLTCSGTALYLAIAKNQTLTVNLNGHRLTGNGTGTGLVAQTSLLGNETLVVINGTITRFASAVITPTGSAPSLIHLTLRNLRLTANGAWLGKKVLRNVLVENSVITDSGDGGAYPDSANFTVRNTRFIRSSIASSAETTNYLYNNTFVGGTGFRANSSSSVTAIGNSFRDCETGISMYYTWYSLSQVVGNTFTHCQTGVKLNSMGGPVLVQGNTFVDNTVVGLTYLNDLNRSLRVVGNSFVHNAVDGINGADTRSSGGPATGAGPTQITDNTAIGNGGWGIKATGTVVDGGGNFALDNTNPAQCSGVVCTH